MTEVIDTNLLRTISKRSNDLIYASYDLGAISQDILQVVISQIRDEDSQVNSYRFTIKDLENKLTNNSGYFRRIREVNLKKARKELMSSEIIFKDSSGTVDCFSWSSRFSYNMSEKWIEIELHERLNGYLIDLVKNGKFTLVENQYFLPLKSAYSKRLYMILRNKLDIAANTNKAAGHYKTSVHNLAVTLVIPESITKNSSDLKRRVLEIAMEQINEHTDIKIEYHTEKKGRKVENIVFLVKNNVENIMKQEESEVIEAEYEVVEKPAQQIARNPIDNWLNK